MSEPAPTTAATPEPPPPEPQTLACGMCGETFTRPGQRGPVPKWCSAACRQKAHRYRIGQGCGTSGSEVLDQVVAAINDGGDLVAVVAVAVEFASRMSRGPDELALRAAWDAAGGAPEQYPAVRAEA